MAKYTFEYTFWFHRCLKETFDESTKQHNFHLTTTITTASTGVYEMITQLESTDRRRNFALAHKNHHQSK